MPVAFSVEVKINDAMHVGDNPSYKICWAKNFELWNCDKWFLHMTYLFLRYSVISIGPGRYHDWDGCNKLGSDDFLNGLEYLRIVAWSLWEWPSSAIVFSIALYVEIPSSLVAEVLLNTKLVGIEEFHHLDRQRSRTSKSSLHIL